MTDTVAACLVQLRLSARTSGCGVLACCFMPDHVHFLVTAAAHADLERLVRDFKQRTGYTYRQTNGKALWQKSYYDHVVRREEDLPDVVRYIFGNPVRAALVATASEYPYSGSLVSGRSAVEA